MKVALESVGLWSMKKYVTQPQVTINENIVTRQIYKLYTGAKRLQETSPMMRWWDKDNRRAEGDNDDRVE